MRHAMFHVRGTSALLQEAEGLPSITLPKNELRLEFGQVQVQSPKLIYHSSDFDALGLEELWPLGLILGRNSSKNEAVEARRDTTLAPVLRSASARKCASRVDNLYSLDASAQHPHDMNSAILEIAPLGHTLNQTHYATQVMYRLYDLNDAKMMPNPAFLHAGLSNIWTNSCISSVNECRSPFYFGNGVADSIKLKHSARIPWTNDLHAMTGPMRCPRLTYFSNVYDTMEQAHGIESDQANQRYNEAPAFVLVLVVSSPQVWHVATLRLRRCFVQCRCRCRWHIACG
ncbi:uncharacterized protein CC84DRAFT_479987 [Paraphaeosphaeria sporulosa]|uniref:Uncharacterized protein n=1 Tax=Paraphaeosphaeria sporulosa TaxID=1460663 RepID=A0A177CS32_9PLEO|nr:uncharacterized protein CC84DRAFT_479987 [Paraphaeosphaeria sporulosa]OAG10335.1 hypothetical protein CC84DRAFT_479987 [Paraphaeosphaeria sporulosa]